jgi:NTE family protein
MKKIIHTLLLSVIAVSSLPLCGFASFPLASPRPVESRKKVAVVLSGGGAKGVAHIGALKVIEEEGIPIDIVVGTSMGAVVGGLYSIGYTPRQLDSMVMSQDWGLLLSDRTPRRNQVYYEKENADRYQVTYPFGPGAGGVSGLVRGTNLEMLFNDLMVGHHDSLDFSRLPVRFACVTADVVNGSELVFEHGVLPVAMRASMAIPGFFTPIYVGDKVLVDGGIVNNFPTDVARRMGADVVIGVDVQSDLKGKDQLSGATQVMLQIVDVSMQQQDYPEKVADTDVYVKVDVEGYSSQSFNIPALDTLMRRGYEATSALREELAVLKREIGLESDFTLSERPPFVPLTDRGEFHIYNVSFDELSQRQQRWVMRKCQIAPNSTTTVERLNHCISILGAATLHSNIYYSLRDTLEGYNLDFHMSTVKGNSVSAGVNFDTEEISSVLVNGTFRLGRHVPMEASVTGRFGKRLGVTAQYTFLASPLSGFKVNYTFNHDDVNVNSAGRRLYNPIYNRHFGSFSFVNMNFLRQNLKMELGLAFQKYYYLDVLSGSRTYDSNMQERHRPEWETNLLAKLDERMWSYFARLDYESLDSRYFSMRGTAVSLGFDLYTDNFYQWKGSNPFSALALSWVTAIPIGQNFSLLPSVYGRILSGGGVPFSMLNMVGGRFFGRYTSQQMPFDGIGYMEIADDVFLAAKVQARHRIARRHYVSASLNYGLTAGDFMTLGADGQTYFGAAVDYGYDLRSFPISVSLNWSNITRSVGFYFQAGYMF